VANPEFLGFVRPDGTAGIRNCVAIEYTVDCARFVAESIARQVRGAVAAGWYSCYQTAEKEDEDTLIGLGRNPNVGAAVVVSLGCETMQPAKIADGITKSNKQAEVLVIQDEGGTLKSIEKGVRMAQSMLREVSKVKRRGVDLSNLVLGVKCGGSDTTSGLSANPATGVAADLVVDAGGNVLFSEFNEMKGCEDLLAKRAINSEVGDLVRTLIVDKVREFDQRFGIEESTLVLTRGNIEGGLTTIEEKALGAILKAGHRPIQGVLKSGQRPTRRGVWIVDGLSAQCIGTFGLDADFEPTDFAAAGTQLTIFTTGRGNVHGNPVAPIIKVCGNPETADRMKDDMDINAGTVIEGKEDVEQVGKRIYEETLNVASGKLTKSEILGHNEGSEVFGGRTLICT